MDLEIKQSAYRDLNGIYDYIADVLLEPGIAQNQTDRIMDAADSLTIVFYGNPETSCKCRAKSI